ncbi:MAG TPA: hypothetical protein DEQ02_00845, partial [Ruminococcaceae bacterium]|nr:hypothetical protein [Oscillospiraceae bacterium]
MQGAGDPEAETVPEPDPEIYGGRVVAGDFDGNGYDDYACAYDYGNGNMAIWVFRSNGANFYAPQKWATSPAHDVTKVTGTMVAGDFNGDGLDDVAWMYDYGNGNMKVWTFLSNGSSFYTHSVWALSDDFDPKRVTSRVVAGDFD